MTAAQAEYVPFFTMGDEKIMTAATATDGAGIARENVCPDCKGRGYTTDGGRNEHGNLERLPCACKSIGEVKRFTTGTLAGDLREIARLLRADAQEQWVYVTESNSVNETLENAQAWRHNCMVFANGIDKAADLCGEGLIEASRSVIADRLAEQLAAGVDIDEIEWPEAWANLAREIKKYGGGSCD